MLLEVGRLLRTEYGVIAGYGEPHRWSTLVRLVVAPPRPPRRPSPEEEWIDEGPLRSAIETSKAGADRIAGFIEGFGRSARVAKTLCALAGWWLLEPERDAEESSAWDRPVATLRDQLCALPGVNLTQADRILLFVGGLPAFPVDRAALRIACRHRWMDPAADHDDWQHFFTREAGEASLSLAESSKWFSAVGRDFCGPRARCERCPLRGLLPSSGPAPLPEEDS
jgi:endonuclease III